MIGLPTGGCLEKVLSNEVGVFEIGVFGDIRGLNEERWFCVKEVGFDDGVAEERGWHFGEYGRLEVVVSVVFFFRCGILWLINWRYLKSYKTF